MNKSKFIDFLDVIGFGLIDFLGVKERESENVNLSLRLHYSSNSRGWVKFWLDSG